ncbi:hypothetical protein A2U01_0005049 [Trifolium medium]|uniref:Uncharacterized protein n=1 Tax=Trifolium medium TaxID=97028 RepID=A0A392MBP3_9FABA|nr:hypothetical protein [Trifolium medium]
MRRGFDSCICAFPVLAGTVGRGRSGVLLAPSRVCEFSTSTTGILLGVDGSLTSLTFLLCKIPGLRPVLDLIDVRHLLSYRALWNLGGLCSSYHSSERFIEFL